MSIGYANGGRQRLLENGARHAAAVNAARQGDVSVALSVVIGAEGQPKTFATALLRLVKALRTDVPAYRITNGRLYVPSLQWGHHRGFHRSRTAELHWLPCWGIESAKAA